MRDIKKATYNLDANLHQHLKMAATAERREMVELVEEALRSYFGWNRMTETEKKELKTYELIELNGKGARATCDFNSYSADLGCQGSDQRVAADLLRYLSDEARISVDVYDGSNYTPLRSFDDTDCLYEHGGVLHLKVTIPGRIRFEQLRQRGILESAQSPGDDLVARLKSMIAQPTHPLSLHDFLVPVVDDARARLERSDIFSFGAHPTQEAFVERIASADEATSKVGELFAIASRWANPEQAKVFAKALMRLFYIQNSPPVSYDMWGQVARYATLRVLYASGVAASANESFELLRQLLVEAKARLAPHEPERPLVVVMHKGAGYAQDYWKWLPGMDRRHTPVSDHLLESLRPSLRGVANTDEDIEESFDRFELLQSLIFADLDVRGESGRFWAPLGAYMWRRSGCFEELRNEIRNQGSTWKPLQYGFFSGSTQRVLELVDELGAFTDRVRHQRGVW